MPHSHAGSIRLIALRDVLLEPEEYLVRKVCRWYSRELRTPLTEVLLLPWDEVLRHYFEAKYEDMDEAELEQERIDLIQTEDERRAREMDDEQKRVIDAAGDAEFQRLVSERARTTQS